MCDFDELSPTYDATKYWSPEKNNQFSEWVEIYLKRWYKKSYLRCSSDWSSSNTEFTDSGSTLVAFEWPISKGESKKNDPKSMIINFTR